MMNRRDTTRWAQEEFADAIFDAAIELQNALGNESLDDYMEILRQRNRLLKFLRFDPTVMEEARKQPCANGSMAGTPSFASVA